MQPTVMKATQTGWVGLPKNLWLIGTARARTFRLAPGCSCASLSPIAAISATVSPRSAPSVSRPKTCSVRALRPCVRSSGACWSGRHIVAVLGKPDASGTMPTMVEGVPSIVTVRPRIPASPP